MYYDPKSKLYCKERVWYRHAPGEDPCYVPAVPQEGTDGQNALAQNAAAGVSGAGVTVTAGDVSATAGSGQDASTTAGSGQDTSATVVSGQDAAVSLGAAGVGAGEGGAGVADAGVAPSSVAAPIRALGGGGKRLGAGWKKPRIAFGFKGGVKVAKPAIGIGSAVAAGGGASASSEDDGDAGALGGSDALAAGGGGGGGGGGGVGSFVKKRRLEDVSKWNARKLEVRWSKRSRVGALRARAIYV